MRDNIVCRLDDIWIHTKEKESKPNTRLKIELFVISSNTDMDNRERGRRFKSWQNQTNLSE